MLVRRDLYIPWPQELAMAAIKGLYVNKPLQLCNVGTVCTLDTHVYMQDVPKHRNMWCMFSGPLLNLSVSP